MVYPEEFKQKVLAAFDNSESVRGYLESGSQIIGRLLDDNSYDGINADEVIEAVESNDLKGIYEKAKRTVAMRALYREWLEMEKSHIESERMHK